MKNSEVLRIQDELLHENDKLVKKKSSFKDKKINSIEKVR